MSSHDTSRRRLDHRQRPPGEKGLGITRSAHRSTSSSSLLDTDDILLPGTVKQCIDFFASAASLPEEIKSQQQIDAEARVQDVRDFIEQGQSRQDAEDFCGVIREVLMRRVNELLTDDAWIFESERLEAYG